METELDIAGCPTDTSIITSVLTVTDHPKTLQANFDAFKFAGSSVVQFRALVTPCVPRCDPILCTGRVRRRRAVTTSTTSNTTLVLANQLTILERDQVEGLEEEEEVESRSCRYRTESSLTVYTVCVVFTVLLLCQCAVILLCVKLRKRNVSQNTL